MSSFFLPTPYNKQPSSIIIFQRNNKEIDIKLYETQLNCTNRCRARKNAFACALMMSNFKMTQKNHFSNFNHF